MPDVWSEFPDTPGSISLGIQTCVAKNGSGGAGMIKKVKEGYKVVSEKSGKNLGGPYKTKEEAKKRLQQVEFFKRKKG